jgi:peptidoglycan/LPS O-acetylase OafA/YrhL
MLIAGGLGIAQPHRWLAWLGAISFPLYAVHGPALRTSEWLGAGNFWGALASIPLAWGIMHLARRFDSAFVRLRSKAAPMAIARTA